MSKEIEYNHNKVRPKINLEFDLHDLVSFLCEGNPGGLNVMMAMIQKFGTQDAIIAILHLDEMNIRGVQLWVALKNVCQGNIEQLRQMALDRSADLVDGVNIYLLGNKYEHYYWRATTKGASTDRMSFYEPL